MAKISVEDMWMMIKLIDKNKCDIVRYIVAEFGGEDAGKKYGIKLTTSKLKEHIKTLCDQWQALVNAAVSYKPSYIDNAAPKMKIKGKHGGGCMTFEQKDPTLTDIVLDIAHNGGSLIHSSLNNDKLAPHTKISKIASVIPFGHLITCNLICLFYMIDYKGIQTNRINLESFFSHHVKSLT